MFINYLLGSPKSNYYNNSCYGYKYLKHSADRAAKLKVKNNSTALIHKRPVAHLKDEILPEQKEKLCKCQQAPAATVPTALGIWDIFFVASHR